MILPKTSRSRITRREKSGVQSDTEISTNKITEQEYVLAFGNLRILVTQGKLVSDE